ncbi:MAG TPA: polymer-forming cytoskeletal protein [Candidatus Sulfotelmatobacter sp.]|jgi:cytoskeletal protein CcmA (bactofilin family)|nr:polymer-forming cytoskeletal protein [Candidatus Sulfotelmatobacter sp.]
MWSKQQTMNETQAPSPAQAAASNAPFAPPAPAAARSTISAPRSSARLGSSLQIKGEITGSEDLQIDGIVDGPIFLDGHALTVGSTAQLNSEIHAGEVVVYGKTVGNIDARGRVEITKDGSIVGDIFCARISIEDGAHFKGRIEIDPAKYKAATI